MLERSDCEDVSNRPGAGIKSQKRRPQASVEDVLTTGRIAERWPNAKPLLGGAGNHEVCEGWGVRQELVVSLLASEMR
jgi:hypothetical protein